MAHIDITSDVYLIVEGEPRGNPCTCWDTTTRGRYGEVFFWEGHGRATAEIVVRAINEAIRTGALPPEDA